MGLPETHITGISLISSYARDTITTTFSLYNLGSRNFIDIHVYLRKSPIFIDSKNVGFTLTSTLLGTLEEVGTCFKTIVFVLFVDSV